MEASGEVGQLVEAPRSVARPSGGAGAESWHGALAVVPYLNLQLVRPIANGHVRVAGTRVLERIRQASWTMR
jgi:hypothetical protein